MDAHVCFGFSLSSSSTKDKKLTSRTHHPVKVDGHTLSVAAIVAAARHAAPIRLDDSKRTKDRVEKSRQVVVDKVESGASIYGLSTGFGGSGTFLFAYLSCAIL